MLKKESEFLHQKMLVCLIEISLNAILDNKLSLSHILKCEVYTGLKWIKVNHFWVRRKSELGVSREVIYSDLRMPYEQVIWWGWRWSRRLLSYAVLASISSGCGRIFHKDKFVRAAYVTRSLTSLYTFSILWNISGRIPCSLSFSHPLAVFHPWSSGDPCLYHLSNGNFVRGHKFSKLANFTCHSYGVGAYRTFLETQTVIIAYKFLPLRFDLHSVYCWRWQRYDSSLARIIWKGSYPL